MENITGGFFNFYFLTTFIFLIENSLHSFADNLHLLACVHFANHIFSSACAPTMFDNGLRYGNLLFFATQSGDLFCLTHGKQVLANQILYFLCQVEQTQDICYCSTASANFYSNLFLSKLTFFHQAFNALGFFNCVQVVALDIFDESDFHHLSFVIFLNHYGNFFQACQFRSTHTAFAGNKLIAFAFFAYHQRLYYAIFFNGSCQLLQFFFIKHFTRLIRVGNNISNSNFLRSTFDDFLNFRLFNNGSRVFAKNCTQAFT